jgi:hypothetical protein
LDRWSFLAVRAYATGFLTFKRADRQEERWKLKEEILLGELERDYLVDLNGMLHAEDVAAAQHVAGDEVFSYYHNQAKERYNQTRGLIRPYSSAKKEEESLAKQGWVQRAIAKHKELFPEEHVTNEEVMTNGGTSGPDSE